MKNLLLASFSILLLSILFACGGKTVDPPAPDPVLNTHTFTAKNQLSSDANCFINFADAVVYNKVEAPANQSNIDFILWKYTGTALNKDCYLLSPSQIRNDASGAGQQLEMDLGINTWTVWKNATSSNSDATNAEFDALEKLSQLNTLWNKNTHGLVNYTPLTQVTGELLAPIFIFQDKNGKKGFMRVNSINTDAGGSMTVEVKMEP